MDTTRSPYPGLQPFDVDDAPYYYGRRAVIEKLVGMVARPEGKATFSFVGIIGESGSGKSSLVRAGLLPALSQIDAPGGPWRFGVASPGNDMLGNICHALAMAAIVPREQLQDCLNSLRCDTSSLRHIVEAANSRSPRARFLLVIDQLEEMFTYSVDVNRRDFALESLLTACALPDAPMSVVATIRSDFYGECAQNPRLAELYRPRRYFLPP